MSNSGHIDPAEANDIPGAGSTDQHAAETAETGTFITDQAPDSKPKAHGSSDSGITAVRSDGRGADGDKAGSESA